MQQAARRRIEQQQQALAHVQRLLDSFASSRERLLEQGYVWVSTESGDVVPRAADIAVGDRLQLHFLDGPVDVVAGVKKGPSPAPRPKPKGQHKRYQKPEDEDQGSLL